MRSKSLLLLLLALGCGLVASIGISQVMERRNAQQPAGEMEPIVVASIPLNYNEVITPDKIKIEEWPKGKIQGGAITRLEDVVGKRAATKLFEGEPILTGKLMGVDGLTGAAGKIPSGYRVVSVSVDAVTGASSLILPGDRVDVLVYLASNAALGIKEATTRTILQDIRVFSADSQLERHHGSDESTIAAKTISLLVTPPQAERIALAAGMGPIRLVMRGPEDDAQVEADGASVQDILGGLAEKNSAEDENDKLRQPKSDTLDWLKKQKQEPAAPIPATVTPTSWKMMLLEGGQMRQVEISGDGNFPTISGEKTDFNPGTQPVIEPPAGDAPNDSESPPTTGSSEAENS